MFFFHLAQTNINFSSSNAAVGTHPHLSIHLDPTVLIRSDIMMDFHFLMVYQHTNIISIPVFPSLPSRESTRALLRILSSLY